MFGRAEQVFPARIRELPDISTMEIRSMPFLNQNNGTHGLTDLNLIAMSTLIPSPITNPLKVQYIALLPRQIQTHKPIKNPCASAPPQYLNTTLPRRAYNLPHHQNSKSPPQTPCRAPIPYPLVILQKWVCGVQQVHGPHSSLAPRSNPAIETSSTASVSAPSPKRCTAPLGRPLAGVQLLHACIRGMQRV